MFYMNEKLVHSIQSDRRREADAARLNTVLPEASETPTPTRRRLFSVPSLFTGAPNRSLPADPHSITEGHTAA